MAGLLIVVAVLALPVTLPLTALTWHFVPAPWRGHDFLQRAKRQAMVLCVWSSLAMYLFVAWSERGR